MVGLYSGLTHLSAGLGRPTIGIYKASTPVRTPLEGPAYTASLGERGNAPSAETVLSAVEQALAPVGAYSCTVFFILRLFGCGLRPRWAAWLCARGAPAATAVCVQVRVLAAMRELVRESRQNGHS